MTNARVLETTSLWRNRGFVCLFGAQAVSLLGSGATTIGLALLAYDMAGAGAAIVVLGNALTLRIIAFLVSCIIVIRTNVTMTGRRPTITSSRRCRALVPE